ARLSAVDPLTIMLDTDTRWEAGEPPPMTAHYLRPVAAPHIVQEGCGRRGAARVFPAGRRDVSGVASWGRRWLTPHGKHATPTGPPRPTTRYRRSVASHSGRCSASSLD